MAVLVPLYSSQWLLQLFLLFKIPNTSNANNSIYLRLLFVLYFFSLLQHIKSHSLLLTYQARHIYGLHLAYLLKTLHELLVLCSNCFCVPYNFTCTCRRNNSCFHFFLSIHSIACLYKGKLFIYMRELPCIVIRSTDFFFLFLELKFRKATTIIKLL